MYSNELICKILIYLNERTDMNISIDKLSEEFFYNRFYIMKLFKSELGLTINNYMNTIKIAKAMNEIKNTNHSMLRISIDCGFNSIEYFSETFKQVLGVGPRKYKNFTNYVKIEDKDLNIIRKSIFKIEDIKKRTETYLRNRKPVKKDTLTLFKLKK